MAEACVPQPVRGDARAPEVGLVEPGAGGLDLHEVGGFEVRPAEVGVPQVGTAQVGLVQVGVLKLGSAEHRVAVLRFGHIEVGEAAGPERFEGGVAGGELAEHEARREHHRGQKHHLDGIPEGPSPLREVAFDVGVVVDRAALLVALGLLRQCRLLTRCQVPSITKCQYHCYLP